MKINVLELEMGIKSILEINALVFAGLFSLSANAAPIDLSGDVYGTYLGNDADAVDFMDTTGLTDITELFRDEYPDTPEVFVGTVEKIDYLDYLVVKFNGVFGVYDVSAYGVGETLGWATADFADDCALLRKPNGNTPNCGAATSHVTGYGVVPVPAAVWLFASGLLGLIGIARKRA